MIIDASVIVLASLLILSVICWKLLTILLRTSGDAIRASRDERQLFFHEIERLSEKLVIPSNHQSDLAVVHAQERSNEVNSAASVEKQVVDNEKPPSRKSAKKNPIFTTSDRAINQ